MGRLDRTEGSFLASKPEEDPGGLDGLASRWNHLAKPWRINVVLYALTALSMVALVFELVAGDDTAPKVDVASLAQIVPTFPPPTAALPTSSLPSTSTTSTSVVSTTTTAAVSRTVPTVFEPDTLPDPDPQDTTPTVPDDDTSTTTSEPESTTTTSPPDTVAPTTSLVEEPASTTSTP
jgi:cytoskeletal protein RodZ